jgi:hypothetical protein
MIYNTIIQYNPYDNMTLYYCIINRGMDKALFNSFHNGSAAIGNAVVLNLVCGVVSSNGGGVLIDVLRIFEKDSYCVIRSPAFLSHGADGDAARIKMTKCFFLSCLYYFILKSSYLDHFFSINSEIYGRKMFGHMIICSFQILDLLGKKVFGPSLNVPGTLATAIMTLFHIPRTVQSKAMLNDVQSKTLSNINEVEEKSTPMPNGKEVKPVSNGKASSEGKGLTPRKSSRERMPNKKFD